jgi:hypothetical protein
MKTIILAAIRCSLMFTAVTASLFSIRPAQAYTVTLEQMGSNVVAIGSGAIDLTGLIFGDVGTSVDPFICKPWGLCIWPVAARRFVLRFDWTDEEFWSRRPKLCQQQQRRCCITRCSTSPTRLCVRQRSIEQHDLEQRDLRQPRRDARHLRMDVGDWITEPELHAHHRTGWGAGFWLDNFSARLRFVRLGCAAA